EEQQDHQTGEAGGDKRLAQHALNGGAHEDGLIRESGDFQFRRNVGQDARQGGFHRIDDGESGSLAVARDGDQTSAGNVGADDGVLHLETVGHLGHILDEDGGAVDGFDGQIVEVLQVDGAAVDLHLIFRARELGGARRQYQVLQVQRVGYVDGGELLG